MGNLATGTTKQSTRSTVSLTSYGKICGMEGWFLLAQYRAVRCRRVRLFTGLIALDGGATKGIKKWCYCNVQEF